MTIEEKVRRVVVRKEGNVLLRADFSGLGSPSRINGVLDQLVRDGDVTRIGTGIYAKSSKDPATGRVSPVVDLQHLALEALKRLGYEVWIPQKEALGESSLLTLGNEVRVRVAGRRRIKRKLSIGEKTVVYVYDHAASKVGENTTIRNPETGELIIPTTGVRDYVLKLARRYQVTYVKTFADTWAEDVSRLAGDEVRTDAVEQLVIALKKHKKVSGREMVKLLTYYLREKEVV
ncbi:hypothetical protein [Pseudomonas syringae]|uniref:Uncharacterized protein n=3 Tax=Pseudomonas syringae TaxID=317 RepID=A0A656K4J4_PSESF|nr:hypothetical protein [Pseudomonas syringae]EPN69810.1 hypothetical protein A245_01421 [Pseudomonas syringae pv. actinidiae ICMP 19096]EPM43627.1 hypothetical protein A246_26368 [Pseudomonas syringae pv. actinidiae ICMP 19098]EPM70326.1 hypothetical protein A249_37919 [Pseudomonas syringae pv. actinidiae ICMP 18804]EPN14666.1 hypothetical protein A248_26001 [Pseudomonas syringae pv. actinidiae ICMP 19100]EPN23200.1 hypothetical protein A247_26292 [Pseudomonas syringae pv. actinidiae ICMP 190